jgi:hypothetical protein
MTLSALDDRTRAFSRLTTLTILVSIILTMLTILRGAAWPNR